MNKVVVVVALLIASITVGIAGSAQAASLQDVLNGVNKLQPMLSQVEQLNQMQDQWKNGNRTAVYASLAKVALQQANINLPVDVTSVTKDNLSSVTKDGLLQAVKDQIQQIAMQKLQPYQETVSVLQNLGTMLNPSVGQSVATNGNVPPLAYKQVLDMTATAYAPGPHDNGKWGNQTYVGSVVKKGVVAVDPTVIPMGSKVWVEGYGYAVADDQGSAIKGNRIDLAFDGLQQALDYGIQHVKVYVLK